MFLKKKAHNLFSKSIKLELKGVKGSVKFTPTASAEVESVDETVTEDAVKVKKGSKSKKTTSEEEV